MIYALNVVKNSFSVACGWHVIRNHFWLRLRWQALDLLGLRLLSLRVFSRRHPPEVRPYITRGA